ncbi:MULTISPECIES: MerR family transcriptional regulator [Streptomyces]|uniref:MerR family transcriptional regulator n=1 Tax=Streptomyces sviceus (strain ATCC 29083 / DSM 924 / JCM 4929 / NBRC 13980 / NCIMB 11184 / NRRL 5439 / UC 5370) TaxID=463191 RepID=B5I1H5_STRX2|nr:MULTISPECIES: MerR family transcriptional regulator [Streptomyces]EDY58930.1 MerR family transcriptional regulator [Streptomyces sviceus ATCC 29083]MYT03582.1 MerR family transcriptional regulator [Streptomyces sp. SID5470]
MDDGGTLHSIGDLARQTGLTVKTIRFWSDEGIVPPADRTHAGYRRYGPEAVARLAFVRTLRELGLGLDAIRQILDRELALDEVAAQHAAALDAQIGILRLRRAVLTAVARRGPTPEETHRMHELARLSETERRRLIDDFLDAVFPNPGNAAGRRSMTPELPDRPTEGQLEAWIELAELTHDPDFRAGLRRIAEAHRSDVFTPPSPDVVALARDHAEPALDAGIAPESPEADPVVTALCAHCARTLDRPDDTALRRHLLSRLESAHDPRRDRYLELLALINAWPPPIPLTPALVWFTTALRVRTA